MFSDQNKSWRGRRQVEGVDGKGSCEQTQQLWVFWRIKGFVHEISLLETDHWENTLDDMKLLTFSLNLPLEIGIHTISQHTPFQDRLGAKSPLKMSLQLHFWGFLVNFRRWLSCQPSLQVFWSAQREEFYRTFWGLVFLKSRKWNFNELKNDTRLPSGTEILKW